MKLVVACVLAVIFICGVSAHITEWGDIRSAKFYGFESVYIPPNPDHFTRFELTFPKENGNNFTIRGIKQTDFEKHPSTVEIKKGGIGHNNVTLEIWAPQNHAVNSTFTFYLF